MIHPTKILILEEKLPGHDGGVNRHYKFDELSHFWVHYNKIEHIHKNFNLLEIIIEDFVKNDKEIRHIYGIFSDPKEAFRFALKWDKHDKSNPS